MLYTINTNEQTALMDAVRAQDTPDAKRIVRCFDLPDLTRIPGNPVQCIVQKILSLPRYKSFDSIEIPQVVATDLMFDTYNFPADHPARSASDTYYVDPMHVLRPHTTVMWRYYLQQPGVREKLETDGEVKCISYGKVYRRDEIDCTHYPVFHNIDAIHICKKEKRNIGRVELETVLRELTESLYGTKTQYNIVEDKNPYTHPTLEVELLHNGKRLEILGSGVVRPELLQNLGLDPEKYTARARGPGIDRLAMYKMGIPDIRLLRSQDPRITSQRGNLDTMYQNVSKYPSIYRDISFIIPKKLSLNERFDVVRDCGPELIEEVTQLDAYENDEKFGADNKSYTYRIVYRSHERTLTNEEINLVQETIRNLTASTFGAVVR